MARILISGASGFLGSALARHWATTGHQVHVLVRPASSLRRLETTRDRLAFHVAADTSAAAAVVSNLRPEVLVHTACAYGRNGETPAMLFEANVALGVRLLQALLDGGDRATFLNTSSVLTPDVSLYALGKHQFSDWGAQVATRFPERLQFVDVRLQHMYGPGDDASKFTTHVLRACMRGEPVLNLTTGEQRRDFIHVDDVVSAYDTLLQKLHRLTVFDAIEVGSGDAGTVRAFVELAHRLIGTSTRLEFGAVPYRPKEAMLCVADTARLRALGWKRRHDLESGLADTIRKEATR